MGAVDYGDLRANVGVMPIIDYIEFIRKTREAHDRVVMGTTAVAIPWSCAEILIKNVVHRPATGAVTHTRIIPVDDGQGLGKSSPRVFCIRTVPAPRHGISTSRLVPRPTFVDTLATTTDV